MTAEPLTKRRVARLPRYNGPSYYNAEQRRAYVAMCSVLDVEWCHGWCGPDWVAASWGTVAILCMSRPGEWAYVARAS